MAKILVVDDEPGMLEVLSTLLRQEGHEVVPTLSGEKALEIIGEQPFDLVITDIKMEPVDGMDVLRAAKRADPGFAVIVITAYATVETAVEAMKLGAYDYVGKPFKVDELKLTVERALTYQSAIRENTFLREQLKQKYRFENIVGNSGPMQRVYELMEKVARTDSTVLILGESGTGKELVARALHFNSRRKDGPFVAINCGALPESLLESELFGHVKGAFTGAAVDKKGLFQVADGGTIFLDEIGSTPLPIQMKLLRVLQDMEIRRVGDVKTIKVDVRVLAATNEPLEKRIEESSFREDLYYRISVIPIELPALRDRRDDIPLLVHHFLERCSEEMGVPQPRIEDEALRILTEYSWPGNVRELQNAIERAVALCDNSVVSVHDLPSQILRSMGLDPLAAAPPPAPGSGDRSLKAYLRRVERDYIRRILSECDGSKEAAAETLEISLATLYRKLNEEKG